MDTYEPSDQWSDKFDDSQLPPIPQQAGSCTSVGSHRAQVTLPVALKPKTTLGSVETECCGDPSIICRENRCTHLCEFLIVQKICIKIPVTYSTTASAGDPSIFCGRCGECGCGRDE
ncbi:MAG: hypothetical protein LKE53_06090 [Oscillospiraceae bacterium]|nr:hypothetical protein [Oscillospiraceae bacterium]MDD3261386.1 hypothetical protein [Oscillospiraceae bacterium]